MSVLVVRFQVTKPKMGLLTAASKHRLPEPLLVAIMRRRVTSEAFAIKIGHGLAARKEVALLAAELAAMAEATSIETPATKRLIRYLDRSAEPLADGSQKISPHWRVA